MPSWENIILKKLKEIRKSHCHDGVDLNAVPFWSFQFQINNQQLDSALKEISFNIEGGRTLTSDWPTIIILFYVVRSRLKNVAANYMWPEVARELNRASDLNLGANQCGIYFRKILLKKYQNELQQRHLSFPYVALLLSQAGAGKDRRRIVSKYFDQLAESLRRSRERPLTTQIVYDCYSRLSRDNTDVQVLEGVLLYSGKILINLISALRNKVNPIELSLWDWKQLVTFWRRETGGNLELVLPEAAEFFSRIIDQLPDVITRGQLATLLNENSYEISGPGVDIKKPVQECEVPMTTAKFQKDDTSRHVTVADSSGYNAETIERLPAQKWHYTRSYLIYRDVKPFTVSFGIGNVVSSLSYFRKNHEKPSGYFWSGHSSDQRPFIVENNLKADETVNIRSNVVWDLSKSSISCHIISVDIRYPPFSEDYYLILGNKKIWQGVLRDKKINIKLSEHVSLISLFDDVTLELYSSGRKLSEKTVSFPYRNKPFLLTDLMQSQILDKDWLEQDRDIDSFFLIVPEGDHVHVDGASHNKKISGSKNPFPGSTHDVYNIISADEKADDLCIYINKKLWFCGRNLRLCFIRPSAQKVRFDNVSFTGAGSIYPLVQDLEIRTPVLLPGKNVGRQSLYVRVTSNVSSTNIGLNEIVTNGVEGCGLEQSIMLSVERLLQLNSCDNGLLLLHLCDKGGFVFDSLTVLPFSGKVEIQPCRIGQHSVILVHRGELHDPLAFSSSSEVNREQNEAVYLYGTEDSSSLEIRWLPRLRDIYVLSEGKHIPPSGEVRVNSGENTELVAEGLSTPCTVSCNGRSLKLKIDGHISLVELLNDLGADGSEQPFLFHATSEGIDYGWPVHFNPELLFFRSEWKEEEDLFLDIDFSCFSLQQSSISFCCRKNDICFSKAVPTHKEYDSAGFRSKGQVSLHVPDIYSETAVVLEVSVAGNVLEQRTVTVPVRIQSDDPEGIKHKIINLVKGESESVLDPELLEYELLSLVGRYAYLTGEVPFPLQRLTDAVNHLAQERSENYPGLCSGFLLLEHLEQDIAQFPGDVSNGTEPVCILLNTLKMVLEIRRMRNGLARPDFFATIAEYSRAGQAHYQDTIFCVWLSFLEEYARLILEILNNNIKLDERSLHVPEELLGIFIFQYPEFNQDNLIKTV